MGLPQLFCDYDFQFGQRLVVRVDAARERQRELARAVGFEIASLQILDSENIDQQLVARTDAVGPVGCFRRASVGCTETRFVHHGDRGAPAQRPLSRAGAQRHHHQGPGQ